MTERTEQRSVGGIRLRQFDRSRLRERFRHVGWEATGKVTDVLGTVIEAHLPGSRVGTVARLLVPDQAELYAEVVGFHSDKVLLLPYSSLNGIAPGCPVKAEARLDKATVGAHLLGKVIDPLLNPMSGEELTESPDAATMPLDRDAPNPMERARIRSPLSLGVRTMDGLLTFGEGQRIGIMAGSGVGKSVLMGMIARGSSSDVNVIGLIGERGREVREFLERDLGEEGLAKSVVVCVTSDQSPLMRIRGAKLVTAIAEYFSTMGQRVLLMMDSLTRVAMAQREIGLAVGEPPTTKGYPPSVFALLPRLLERCGPQKGGRGSISGLYTVLVDGDDFNDPMPDAARAILDGHINLSRELAAKGHFPAIDVPTSVSRVMSDIVTEEHQELAKVCKTLLGSYRENYDYVQIGSYQQGTNPTLDAALDLMPSIESYLKQDVNDTSTLGDAVQGLRNIFRSAMSQDEQNPADTDANLSANA